jgi:DNA topoisomerase-1
MKRNKTRGEYRRCLKCGNEWDIAQPAEAEALAG